MSTRRKHPRGNPAGNGDGQPADSIDLASGVNIQGAPFVHVTWGAKLAQLDVDETRQFGLHALAVAEAAEHDAIVNAWLKDKLDTTPAQAAQIIAELREYRADTTASTITPDRVETDDTPPQHPAAALVRGEGIYVPAGRARPDLLDPTEPGRHVWFVATTHVVSDESAAAANDGGRVNLDAETIAMVATGCFVCEQPYTPELAAEKCTGEPT